ncbi:uncharacterized protein LOC131884048 [Tigriopus californicus]|uniref:uncharacterized protein LOC131884048 n=1 Tax=Tigriopus californicus TaxID=6832 RepID=UPI0027DA70CD|nr:uncharacterized protein LOC131884048 [Tigriopus californicus]
MKMRLLTFLSSYSSFIFLLTNAFILTPRLQQRALEVEVVKSPSSSPTSSGSVLVKSLGQRQGIVQGQRGASFQLEPTQSDYGDSRQVEDISVDNLVISRDLPGVHDDKDDRFHPEGREIYGGAVVSPHGISGIRELRRHVFPSTIDDDYEYDDDDDDLRDEDGQQTRGQSGESVAALPKKSLFHLNEAKWTVKQTPSSFSMELVHPSKPSLTTTDDKASKRDKRQHASLYYPQELNYLANLPKYQKIPGRPRLPFHPLPPATHHGPTVSPNVIRELPPIYYGPRSTQSPVKHIYYPQNETKQKFTGHNAPQKLDPQRQEYIGYVRSQADQHHQGPYHPLSGTTTTFRPLVYHSTLASPTRPSGKYVQTFPHTTKSPVDVPYVEAIPQATDSRPLPKQTRPHHLQQQQQQQQQQSPFNRQKLRLQKELIALRKLQSLYGQEPSAPSAVQRPFHTPAVLPIAVHASPDWAGFKQLATQDAHKLREPANTKNNPYSYKILGNEVRDQKPHSKRGISHTFARGDHSGNSIQDDRESFDYYAPHLSDLTFEEPEEYVEDDELPDQYETESKLKTKPVFDTFGYWVPSQRNPFDVVEGSKDRLPN